MQSLFDDVARILAKPAPRRQALKLAAGVFAGGILGALGVGRASDADIKCLPGKVACGAHGLCCPITAKCCITAARGAYCIANKKDICCGTTACGPKEVCCAGACCNPGVKCVNGRCSSSSAT